MAKVVFKRDLPENLEEKFNDGRIAHIIMVTHKIVDGEWQEHHIVCMSPRHEFTDADGRELMYGEDAQSWAELEGEPDLIEDGDGKAAYASAGATETIGTDAPSAIVNPPTGIQPIQLSTSYRKCKSNGQRCYLLSGPSGQTCRYIGGSATNLPICDDT